MCSGRTLQRQLVVRDVIVLITRNFVIVIHIFLKVSYKLVDVAKRLHIIVCSCVQINSLATLRTYTKTYFCWRTGDIQSWIDVIWILYDNFKRRIHGAWDTRLQTLALEMCSRSEDIKGCCYRILENPKGGFLASVKGVQLESPSTITNLSRSSRIIAGLVHIYAVTKMKYFIYLLKYWKDNVTVSRRLTAGLGDDRFNNVI